MVTKHCVATFVFSENAHVKETLTKHNIKILWGRNVWHALQPKAAAMSLGVTAATEAAIPRLSLFYHSGLTKMSPLPKACLQAPVYCGPPAPVYPITLFHLFMP